MKVGKKITVIIFTFILLIALVKMGSAQNNINNSFIDIKKDTTVPPGIIFNSGPDMSFPGQGEFPGNINPFQPREKANNISLKAYIYQNGDNNEATIFQFGEDNSAGITQNGNLNKALIQQKGDLNEGEIIQIGNNNEANLYQKGENGGGVSNTVGFINQWGDSNKATMKLSENGEENGIIQAGNDNTANTEIFGNSKSIKIKQLGSNIDLGVESLFIN